MYYEVRDVYGKLRIKGEYGSFKQCIGLNKSNLESIDFKRVNLIRADFKGVRLRDASFRGTDIQDADFQNADLQRSNFQEADAQGANFSGTDVIGAYFDGADFSGADFTNSNINCEQLYGVNCSHVTLDHTLVKIQGSLHMFCAYDKMIKIGCEYHNLGGWIENKHYTDVYNKKQQKEYMGYILMYQTLLEGESHGKSERSKH